MVIVTIIGIMAAIAAPGMMRAMQVNRAQRATMDVARLGRAGRSDALSFGRAYLVARVPGATGRGRVELWRGITDTCRTNPWAAIMATGGGCLGTPPSTDCVDYVDMDHYSTTSGWVTLTTPGPTWMCFEPDAELWVSNGGAGFTQPPTGVLLTLQRFDSASGGIPLESRGILFPLTSAPRTQR
jgi:type II secretory pathway pseudopilin PulG